MSCPRLSRRSLHLVLSAGCDQYALSSMDISRLFYPSCEEAKTAETKPKDVGSLPTIYYSPVRLPASCAVPSSDRWKDAFALFDKNKILRSNAGGCATIYNTESHSFMSMPELNSPKGPRYITVNIPRTAAHTRANFEIHPDVDSSMFGDKQQHLLVGGTTICVSSDKATFSFDTVGQQWNKTGDWVLPFHSKLEYDTELKMWFGILSCWPSELFCIAKYFDIIDDQDDYESQEGVLSMVNQWFECFITDEIEWVL
ncbi:hypothetical protein PVAP13_3KG504000 [Panicum virgatum]|uniref:Uncharacterized protein n=1 Tax=Panicum virgatum TaxID=38727 RepID=A0A8T0V4C3_PANVG|nr:hypothetical protein PVAP13_3KG504000 [Panicum virgatum]